MDKNRKLLSFFNVLAKILSAKITELFFILDEQLNILFINDSAKKEFRCSDIAAGSIDFLTFCSKNRINTDFYDFINLYVSGQSTESQELFYKNGKFRWSIEPVEYEQSKYYIVQTINFVQNKNKETIHNLESLIENMPCNVYWMDKECLMVGCNQNVLNMLQMSKEEFIGKSYEELSQLCNWPEGLATKLKNDDLTVINTGTPIIDVEDPPFPNQDDSFLYFLTSRVPLYNQLGEIIGVAGISTDISALKQARELAEAASVAKTEFIANMSHDIRTPLTGVIGLSEILENTLKNPQEREKAHLLHDSGEELLHMLNGILDVVQAENLQEKDVKIESFDLYQCIHELIRLELPATSLKNLELKEYIAPNVPRYIRSDRNKIHRILLNLLGNSIKFTQTGSITLEIECLHIDGIKAHLRFGVSDTGIGIPEESQSQVFNRFFKVSSSYKGIYTGHGLGLHIVQSYVNLLGGNISLTSKEGHGSTFNFDLECELGTAPIEEVQHQISLPTNETEQAPIRLLLVEDNEIALKTLEFLLSQKGCITRTANSGEDALVLFDEQPFDLIITDIGLPGISGNDLSRLIRTQSSIPIIGLTGHAQGAIKEECINSGINAVYTKPVQIELLYEGIQILMRQLKKNSVAPVVQTLPGFDLSDKEKKLFELEDYPLFNESLALEQIPDKALLITLLQAYLSEQIQGDLYLIEELYKQQDWQKIEKTTHKIKGGVAYLGTQKMFYACQHLEQYYKAGHRSLLEPLYQQIIKINKDTIQELNIWLQKTADPDSTLN